MSCSPVRELHHRLMCENIFSARTRRYASIMILYVRQTRATTRGREILSTCPTSKTHPFQPKQVSPRVVNDITRQFLASRRVRFSTTRTKRLSPRSSWGRDVLDEGGSTSRRCMCCMVLVLTHLTRARDTAAHQLRQGSGYDQPQASTAC